MSTFKGCILGTRPCRGYPVTSDDVKIWFVKFFPIWGRSISELERYGFYSWDYWIAASSERKALAFLKSGALPPRSYEIDSDLAAYRNGADVRRAELDFRRLVITRVDLEGLDRSPDARHACYVVQERVLGVNEVWPSRFEILDARREAARKEAIRIAAETPDLQRPYADLDEDLRRRIRRVGKTGCWHWIGDRDYYGIVQWGGERWATHRLVYTLLAGKIPDGAVLRHTCDRKYCCNPAHLIPGTHFENRMDSLTPRSERKIRY